MLHSAEKHIGRKGVGRDTKIDGAEASESKMTPAVTFFLSIILDMTGKGSCPESASSYLNNNTSVVFSHP
jgi:glyceraldehyde-3-phosphate dehydrogenase/erythrose-4-phosphate dehydrogenase